MSDLFDSHIKPNIACRSQAKKGLFVKKIFDKKPDLSKNLKKKLFANIKKEIRLNNYQPVSVYDITRQILPTMSERHLKRYISELKKEKDLSFEGGRGRGNPLKVSFKKRMSKKGDIYSYGVSKDKLYSFFRNEVSPFDEIKIRKYLRDNATTPSDVKLKKLVWIKIRQLNSFARQRFGKIDVDFKYLYKDLLKFARWGYLLKDLESFILGPIKAFYAWACKFHKKTGKKWLWTNWKEIRSRLEEFSVFSGEHEKVFCKKAKEDNVEKLSNEEAIESLSRLLKELS